MGVSSEVATAVADKAVPSRSLKIKILVKKPGLCPMSEQVAEANGCEKFSLTTDRTSYSTATKKSKSDMGNKHVNEVPMFAKANCLEKSSLTNSRVNSAVSKNQNSVVGVKRKPEEMSECLKGKKSKMDRRGTSQCQNILAKLMKNRFAGAFLKPVVPAECGAPDYFDVIKHPMDLGTIKTKLQQNTYSGPEEFEADVRLTFANAMLYNPPNHFVHQHAKILNGEFVGLWKSVKGILFRGLQIGNKSINDCVDITVKDVKGKCTQSKSCPVDAVSGIGSQDPKKVSVAEPWRDLKGLKDDNVKGPKESRPIPDSAGPVSHLDKESVFPISVKLTQKKANGVKVSAKELNAVEETNTRTLQQSRSDQDSEGAVSCVDEEHASASTPVTAGSLGTATLKLESILDIQLSPSKALRAAKLKSRFADTILKAQNKVQPEKGGGYDGASLQEQKERWERKQQEEKARIEAQVRAAELAERLKAESEVKKRREEARAALEQMERSTDLDDNFHTLKELEALIGSSLVVVCHDSRSRHGRNKVGSSDILGSPLERLGLYIKAEYKVGDDDDDDDEFLPQEKEMEEGEIIV